VDDYVEINRAHWDSRVPHHVAGYGLDDYRRDPTHLSDVVRFDRPRLGDLEGLDVLHLQCHIGTDTLSLARLGARVSGLDFSAPALAAAAQLAAQCGASIDFVESELYDAPAVLAPRRAAVGAHGRGPAATRGSPVPARGPPGAVVARRAS
jgi:2-polyprenyl-3-methyl-5-hydroxy-6-metoxy-1,4-benzoquinol methylase